MMTIAHDPIIAILLVVGLFWAAMLAAAFLMGMRSGYRERIQIRDRFQTHSPVQHFPEFPKPGS